MMSLPAAQHVLPSNSTLPGMYDDCPEQDDDSQNTEYAFSGADLSIPSFIGDGFNWVQEVYRTNFPGSHMGSERDIDHEALKIWKLFFSCEAYQKYRKGPPETTRRRKSPVWPDHLEGAFMKAIVLYPGIGKKKVVCPTGKGLRGKNEMIYDTIYRCTNQMMTRKQISSHIQVLRNYVEHTPVAHILLPYLPPQKKKRALKRAHDSRYHTSKKATKVYSRAMSRHNPPMAQIAKRAQDTHSLGSPFKARLYTHRKPSLMGPDGQLFEPECFNMIVQSEDKEEVYPITSFDRTSGRAQDLAIDPPRLSKRDSNIWAPLLSTVQDGGAFPGAAADCQVVYLESSLALMDDVPRGASLTISFFINCRPGAGAAPLERDWAAFEVRSAFYEDGAFLDGLADKPVAYDPRARLLEVPLGAEFWAKRIMVLASSRRRAAAAAVGGRAESAEAGYAEARAQLSRLSAVQTVYARPRAAPGAGSSAFAAQQRVRLLAMLWRFDLAAPGAPGRTSWRNVTFQPAASSSSVGVANVLAMAPSGFASPLAGFGALNGSMTSAMSMPDLVSIADIGPFDAGAARAPLFAVLSSAAVQNNGARSLAAQQQHLCRQAAEFAATTGYSPPGLFAPSPTAGHGFAPLPHSALLPAAAGGHLHHQHPHARNTALGLNYLRGGSAEVAVTTCGAGGGGVVAVPPLGVSESPFDPSPASPLDHGMFETHPSQQPAATVGGGGAPWGHAATAHGPHGKYYGAGSEVDGPAAAHGASVDEMGVYGGGEGEFYGDGHHHHHAVDKSLVLDEDGNLHPGNGDMMGGGLMTELNG